MLRIPLPEYADGTLRKLTANLSLYPFVSSVPLSLHTRLTSKAPYMHGKRKSVILGKRDCVAASFLASKVIGFVRFAYLR